MTREEAIKMLKYNSNVIHKNINGDTDPKEVEALDMAIKALERESCEDCVSRKAMLEAITEIDDNTNMDIYTNEVREIISALPSVTLSKQLPANVIPIPEGATNGDVIKAMFPNCEQKENIHNGYFEMYFDGDFGNPSYMRVREYWWNAKYKKEVEE